MHARRSGARSSAHCESVDAQRASLRARQMCSEPRDLCRYNELQGNNRTLQNVSTGREWLLQMGRGAAKHGVALQCAARPNAAHAPCRVAACGDVATGTTMSDVATGTA